MCAVATLNVCELAIHEQPLQISITYLTQTLNSQLQYTEKVYVTFSTHTMSSGLCSYVANLGPLRTYTTLDYLPHSVIKLGDHMYRMVRGNPIVKYSFCLYSGWVLLEARG